MDSEHRARSGSVSQTGGFNELFFFVLNGTRAYPEGTLAGWMEGAGFERIRKVRLLFAPTVLLFGRRPL